MYYTAYITVNVVTSMNFDSESIGRSLLRVNTHTILRVKTVRRTDICHKPSIFGPPKTGPRLLLEDDSSVVSSVLILTVSRQQHV